MLYLSLLTNMKKKAPEFDLNFLTPPWLGLPKNSDTHFQSTTNNVEEFDKKIKELKSVEQWLNLNLGILQSTIQGLEVQKNTIVALTAAVKSNQSNSKNPNPLDPNEEFSNIMANATSLWWSNVEDQMEKFLKTNPENISQQEKNENSSRRKKKPNPTIKKN